MLRDKSGVKKLHRKLTPREKNSYKMDVTNGKMNTLLICRTVGTQEQQFTRLTGAAGLMEEGGMRCYLDAGRCMRQICITYDTARQSFENKRSLLGKGPKTGERLAGQADGEVVGRG